jgi:hypothetical protein
MSGAALFTSIEPFRECHVAAVREFNQRIAAGGIPYQFPESPVPEWLPQRGTLPIYQEYFVAVAGKEVCGAYILKRQMFWCRGEIAVVGGYQLPISEGVIDIRHKSIGVLLLEDAFKREPLLFALGIGGYSEPKARLLTAMNWPIVSCPFYFKVYHPRRFFQETAFLRRKPIIGTILDAELVRGVGAIGLRCLQRMTERVGNAPRDIVGEEADSFSGWADTVWQRAKSKYYMVAVRNAAILNTLYPPNNPRFIKIKVLRNGQVLGWAVMLNTKMNNHKHFGNMRVGSVIDCLAIPGGEVEVVAMATRKLKVLDVDVVVTNQLHRSWCKAFARNGYLRGPSNFLFAVCPDLATKLRGSISSVHMTRGDGDGPIHL